MEVTEQIGVLLTVTTGVLDNVPLDRIDEAEAYIRKDVGEDDLFRDNILNQEKIGDDAKNTFI